MLPLHQGSLCSLWSLGVRGDQFSLGHLADLDLPWNRTHMHIFVVRWKARTFIFHESTYTQHRSVSCVLFISELERRMRQRTQEIPAVLWWEVEEGGSGGAFTRLRCEVIMRLTLWQTPPTLAPSFPADPGKPCSPGGPGEPGWPLSPVGPVSPDLPWNVRWSHVKLQKMQKKKMY